MSIIICLANDLLRRFPIISEEKTGDAQDGSKVIPMDVLKAELFFPERAENCETSNLVKRMAIEVAGCMLPELQDPKKVT